MIVVLSQRCAENPQATTPKATRAVAGLSHLAEEDDFSDDDDEHHHHPSPAAANPFQAPVTAAPVAQAPSPAAAPMSLLLFTQAYRASAIVAERCRAQYPYEPSQEDELALESAFLFTTSSSEP
jgi:hypothetical protein